VISKKFTQLENQKRTNGGRLRLGLLSVFTLIALLAAADLVSDLDEGATLTHLAVEACMFAIGFVGAILIAQRLVSARRAEREARRLVASLENRLRETEAEAARWRDESRELLGGLGQALDRQFERWGLSPAEKEVALLLLKGLTHKEIADVRAITEATARQQARAVYKKGGLNGRHDLAAFFLEDLLLPPDAEDDSSVTVHQRRSP
jgi:DNA-binding CsgD family transcriptional regulator